MKIISWNVNGLRACIGKGFFDFVKEQNADIYCLQETKMQPEQADFDSGEYEIFWNSAEKKGYSGVAVLTRIPPINVTYGIGIDKHDHEGRVLTLEFENFYLVNCYTPNSQNELKRLDYRMEWEDDFRNHLKQLDKNKPIVLCGDLNVAHTEIDLKNPKSNVNNAGFTVNEREKMTALLESGFVDTWRHFNPDTEGVYSWWSYRFNARKNNAGWRIDYFIVSNSFINNVTAADILTQVFGSDHCPVLVEIKQ